MWKFAKRIMMLLGIISLLSGCLGSEKPILTDKESDKVSLNGYYKIIGEKGKLDVVYATTIGNTIYFNDPRLETDEPVLINCRRMDVPSGNGEIYFVQFDGKKDGYMYLTLKIEGNHFIFYLIVINKDKVEYPLESEYKFDKTAVENDKESIFKFVNKILQPDQSIAEFRESFRVTSCSKEEAQKILEDQKAEKAEEERQAQEKREKEALEKKRKEEEERRKKEILTSLNLPFQDPLKAAVYCQTFLFREFSQLQGFSLFGKPGSEAARRMEQYPGMVGALNLFITAYRSMNGISDQQYNGISQSVEEMAHSDQRIKMLIEMGAPLIDLKNREEAYRILVTRQSDCEKMANRLTAP